MLLLGHELDSSSASFCYFLVAILLADRSQILGSPCNCSIFSEEIQEVEVDSGEYEEDSDDEIQLRLDTETVENALNKAPCTPSCSSLPFCFFQYDYITSNLLFNANAIGVAREAASPEGKQISFSPFICPSISPFYL